MVTRQKTPYMGQKAATSRERYTQSAIVPTDSMGHYGAKPWPFNYWRAVEQCSGWVYRCVMGNASAASAVPLRMYVRKRSKLQLKAAGLGDPAFQSRPVPMSRRKYLGGEYRERCPSAAVRHKLAEFGGDFEEVTDHPALSLLRTVNPIFNGFDLAMFRFTMLQLTGNAYLHPVMSDSLMRPTELWPMPSHWTHIVPGESGGEAFIEKYVFGDGYTREQEFAPDEVLHFAKNRGVRDLWYGYGEMEAAWATLGVSVSKRISDKALFDNMSRPDYVLSIEGAGNEEAERTESRINAMHRGVRRVGKALVTSGRAKVQTLQFPPKDVGEFRQILEELAGIFGYPIQKLQAAYEPKANAETADYGWMKDTILPMLRHDEESLNQGGYLGLFGDGALLDDAVLAYDDPVPTNAETERNNTQVYIAQGVWTLNERRAEMGLPPVPGGDVPRVNGISIEALDAQAMAQAEAASQPLGSIMGPQPAPQPLTPTPAPDAAAIARQVVEQINAGKAQEQADKPDPKAKSLTIAKSLAYPMTRTKAVKPPKDHPALTADLAGTYDEEDDALPWMGWMEPADESWIGFLAEDGWLVVYEERDDNGAVRGEPWAVRRDDLIDGDTEPEPERKAPAKYDDIDFKPTRSMAEAAQQGLDYRSQYGRGGTEVGIARARDIANRRNLSPDTVARMASFFARHEQNRDPDAEESDGGPSNGWIAWLLWGGDPGKTWAEKVQAQMERADDEGSGDDGDKGSKDQGGAADEGDPVDSKARSKADKSGDTVGEDQGEGGTNSNGTKIGGINAKREQPPQTSSAKTADEAGVGCDDANKGKSGSDGQAGKAAKAGREGGEKNCQCCKTYAPEEPEGDIAEAVKKYGPDAEFMPIGFKGYTKSNEEGEATGEADDAARDGEPETPIQRMQRRMAEAFREQEAAVLEALKGMKAKRRTKADADDFMNDPRIDAVLESIDIAPMVDAADDALRPMIAAGAQSGADAIGIEVGFDVANPLVEQAARNRAIVLAGDLNQTTLDRLRRSLADGLASGESIPDLSRRVREQFESFSASRAETIARTESALSYEQGQQAAWQDSGVVEGKQWLLAPGACEFCEAIAQQFKDKNVALSDEFVPKGSVIRGTKGGTMKVDYRGLDAAPAHPRCRCDLLPVLSGEFKSLQDALDKGDTKAISKFWGQHGK